MTHAYAHTHIHIYTRTHTIATAFPCRNALADAFGVENPESHVSHFERHRAVVYSPALLQVCMCVCAYVCACVCLCVCLYVMYVCTRISVHARLCASASFIVEGGGLHVRVKWYVS